MKTDSISNVFERFWIDFKNISKFLLLEKQMDLNSENIQEKQNK